MHIFNAQEEQYEPSRIYADADFAGDSSKRSTSGNIIFLSGGPITWSSRLQKLYALSTAEAEIYSLTEALKDAAFLKLHLHALGVLEDKPIPVHEDNSACRIMSANELKTYSSQALRHPSWIRPGHGRQQDRRPV